MNIMASSPDFPSIHISRNGKMEDLGKPPDF